MTGQVIGKAGGSLQGSASWLKDQSTVSAGLRGERNTADELNALTRKDNGPTVLHDLSIPIPGIKANIDHVVVSGRNVTIIDSKLWKPGFYWTLGGKSFRGLSRFEPADKKTLPMAQDGITTYLGRMNIRATIGKPLLVVWPSNTHAPLVLSLLRSPGARALTGGQLTARAAQLVGSKPADPAVVQALAKLVIR